MPHGSRNSKVFVFLLTLTLLLLVAVSPQPVLVAAPSTHKTAGFWARRRIDDLMSQDWLGIERGTGKPELEEQITRLGLDFSSLTQFTSFVAVEDKIVT